MTEQSSRTDRPKLAPDYPSMESNSSQVLKTPYFEALHGDRSQRQALIKRIQDHTKRTLICYVSGNQCNIDLDDTMPFVDLLHNVVPNHDVDLLLHTTGGSTDVAEKLMGMLRDRAGTAKLRIIVPDFAKSAGTLMVLGADKVVMSDMSELGPIDPQVPLSDRWQPAQTYLDAYEAHAKILKTDPENVAARIMLERLDPAVLKMCETAVKRARQAAETLLRREMFRNGGNWTSTPHELLDTRRWLSYGQMISWKDARDPRIGLAVQYYSYDSEDWQYCWQLYCLQRLAIRDSQKLYESDSVSLIIGPRK